MSKSFWLSCSCILVFRLWNALFVRTYFNPDEYWQSTEVAHNVVFGYGHLTWEWNKNAMIRGYAHPLIFVVFYKIIQLTNLDSRWVVAYGPRLMQGMMAAATDYFVYRFGCKYFNRAAAQWILFCHLSCWFTFYTLVRTYSNCIETLFTMMALSYWPWDFMMESISSSYRFFRQLICIVLQTSYKKDDDFVLKEENLTSERFKALCCAAIGVLFRPSNAVLWVFLGCKHLLAIRNRFEFITLTVLPIASLTAALMVIIDYIFYQEWTFVPYNFILFNLLRGKDHLYGSHPWYWYFVQGFPTISATFLPLILYGQYRAPANKKEVGHMILWTMLIYSGSSHKEFRFILPILPASLGYAGYCLQLLHQKYQNADEGSITRGLYKASLVLILVPNIIAMVYLSRWHQRAPMDIMDYVAKIAEESSDVNIHFWTPCHATPYYSVIHRNISMWFPDCSPASRERPEGSQSDQLQRDITDFLKKTYLFQDDTDQYNALQESNSWPDFAILFSAHEAKIKQLLKDHKFHKNATFFHSHFSGDAENRKNMAQMVVYRRA